MERVVIAAASNIDHIVINGVKSKSFLNGAAVYAGYASAMQNKTRVITCVGDEPENEEALIKSQNYNKSQYPEINFIKIKDGKSFKQTFTEVDGKLEVTDKDYGNYNEWEPDVPQFSTDTLLLGTGNPIFQKCVLDSCTHANNILLDSKLIHFKVRADKVDELLKRVDTFLGTKEEMEQLLRNCDLPITMTSALLEKYPNLKVIVEKNSGKGGRVFVKDGTLYRYQPIQPSQEICVDGAGDVFAGTYAGLLSKGENLKEVIRKSAEVAAESVKHFGIRKIKRGLTASSDIRVVVEESRWKSKDERDEKDTDRSH